MKSFTAASIIAMAALVVAQDPAPSGGLGVSPNLDSCKAKFDQCSSGVRTTCQAERDACETACQNTFTSCRNTPGNLPDKCATNWYNCLGVDPFEDNNIVLVTEVVPQIVTFCPGPTTLFFNGQGYTATGPTTITVTNCPCTVVKTVSAVPTGAIGYTNGTGSYSPEQFKGAAGNGKAIGVALSVLAGVSGILAFAL